MNNDRINREAIARGPIASFARVAVRIGAGARAHTVLARFALSRNRTAPTAAVRRALDGAAPRLGAAPDGTGRRLSNQTARPSDLGSARSIGAAPDAATAATMREAPDVRAARPGTGRSGSTTRAAVRRAGASTFARAAFATGLGASGAVRKSALGGNPQLAGASGDRQARADSRVTDSESPPRRRAPMRDFAAALAFSAAARQSLARDAGAPPAGRSSAGANSNPGAATRARRAAPGLGAIARPVRRMLTRMRGADSVGELAAHGGGVKDSDAAALRLPSRAAARAAAASGPLTINSSPSITVNLPPGSAAAGERDISQAVARALEEHAERLYELMRRVGAIRRRVEF